MFLSVVIILFDNRIRIVTVQLVINTPPGISPTLLEIHLIQHYLMLPTRVFDLFWSHLNVVHLLIGLYNILCFHTVL